jgi:hypothetical protein
MATRNRLAARACADGRSVSHAGDATAFVNNRTERYAAQMKTAGIRPA